ncbi:MAG: 3-hydroxyacyl-CoA dehydrogenase family protein [Candidatus Marinimicrobia bacterium]|nr:3-hydroxyacyl-CoA dehydrogenase family protein [Candidatus Neomarinimicrobiota bacterium]
MDVSQISRILVLGTGNMGPGIALQFARAEYDTVIWGRNEPSAMKGMQHLKDYLHDLLREEILSEEEAEQITHRVTPSYDLKAACKNVDFAVEALSEDLKLKQQIFSQLDEFCAPETILASSTSTLYPSSINEQMNLSERMLVAHFWNPAYLAPLVEVCGSRETSETTKEVTMKLLSKIGNEPVLMKKEILGFIGNRLMHAMNREAISLVEKGVVSPDDIDKVINTSFGPRFANLGLLEYLDASGLDLIKSIQGYLYGDLDTTGGVMSFIEQKVEEGELGAKSGNGFFEWSNRSLDDIRYKRDIEFVRRQKRQQKN